MARRHPLNLSPRDVLSLALEADVALATATDTIRKVARGEELPDSRARRRVVTELERRGVPVSVSYAGGAR